MRCKNRGCRTVRRCNSHRCPCNPLSDMIGHGRCRSGPLEKRPLRQERTTGPWTCMTANFGGSASPIWTSSPFPPTSSPTFAAPNTHARPTLIHKSQQHPRPVPLAKRRSGDVIGDGRINFMRLSLLGGVPIYGIGRADATDIPPTHDRSGIPTLARIVPIV